MILSALVIILSAVDLLLIPKRTPLETSFPFIKSKNKNYKATANKLVNTLLDIKIDTDGFIESNNNLFFFYNYTNINNNIILV